MITTMEQWSQMFTDVVEGGLTMTHVPQQGNRPSELTSSPRETLRAARSSSFHHCVRTSADRADVTSCHLKSLFLVTLLVVSL